MQDNKKAMPATKDRRANFQSKLKMAMASFTEYSEGCSSPSLAQINSCVAKEEEGKQFSINLTNLSPSAEQARQSKPNFTFLQDTIKYGDYQLQKLLAQGSFGKVYHVINSKNQKEYAMKVLNTYFLKKYNKSHEAYIERFVLASCKHKNIVKFSKCFAKGDSLCFVMELCENGTLQEYISKHEKINESIIKYFTASIVNGLEHLQSKSIIHRDIKPCNILLDKDHNLKITDFGTSKILDCKDEKVQRALMKRTKREESRSVSPTKKHSFVGTNQYISPEVLKGNEPTPAIDLWSLGVIVYQMYAGETPFLGDNEMDTYQNICDGNLCRHKSIPDKAWAFIKALLKVDPTKRLGYNVETNRVDYAKIKDSPFFEDLSFEDLQYQKALNTRETSVSFGTCSTMHPDHEADKSYDQYEDKFKKNPNYKSFAVPCSTDEDDDEDEFFTDNFRIGVTKVSFVNPDEEKEEVKTRPSSQKNLADYLKEDHFSEINRKYSLKCENESSTKIPLLFDEESEGVQGVGFGAKTPSNMVKHKSCPK